MTSDMVDSSGKDAFVSDTCTNHVSDSTWKALLDVLGAKKSIVAGQEHVAAQHGGTHARS